MRRSKKILALALALLMIIGLANPAFANPINDMNDIDAITPRYEPAIGVLFGLDIMRGTDQQLIHPTRNVVRAEFAALVFRLMTGAMTDVPVSEEQIFTDVQPGRWYYDYVNWAATEGIIHGRGDGTFGPLDLVTLQEASAMLLRALGYGGDPADNGFTGPNWNTRAWTRAVQVGLHHVIAGHYEATRPATREMAAQMIFNALCIDRVQWWDGINIYRPIEPETIRTFGLAFFDFEDIRCGQGLTGVMVMNLGVDEDMRFVNIVTGEETVLPGTATTGQVGRIANVYTRGEDNDTIVFIHVISDDVFVPGAITLGTPEGTSNADLRSAEYLDLANNTAQNMAVFSNFMYEEWEDPLTLVRGTGVGRPLALSRQDATYVIYDGAVRSVVFANRWIADVQITPAGVFHLTRLVLSDELPMGPMAGDRAGNAVADVDTTVVALPYRVQNNSNLVAGQNDWVNVEFNPVTRTYTLTNVETITAVVDAYQWHVGTITVDGVTRRFDHDDTNQLSARLRAHSNFEPIAQDLTTEFTFYISGVTGAFVAARHERTDNFAYILNFGSRPGLWGEMTHWIQVVYIDGTIGEHQVYSELTEDLVDSVVWLRTFEGSLLNPQETDRFRNNLDTDGLESSWNTEIFWAVDGLGEYAIADNADFLYLEVDDTELPNELVSTSRARGQHAGIVAEGVVVWYWLSDDLPVSDFATEDLPDALPTHPAGQLRFVFVMDAHSAEGSIFFLPGPVERWRQGTTDVFTAVAYGGVSGRLVTDPGFPGGFVGVTVRDIVDGMEDPPRNTSIVAPLYEGSERLIAPSGFYRLIGNQLVRLSDAEVTDFPDGVDFPPGIGNVFNNTFFMNEAIVTSISLAANQLIHVDGAWFYTRPGRTEIVDLRPNGDGVITAYTVVAFGVVATGGETGLLETVFILDVELVDEVSGSLLPDGTLTEGFEPDDSLVFLITMNPLLADILTNGDFALTVGSAPVLNYMFDLVDNVVAVVITLTSAAEPGDYEVTLTFAGQSIPLTFTVIE